MSKYLPLDDPITRREACTILDRKRFDAAVRAGVIETLGKRGADGNVVPVEEGAQTAPLVFSQEAVRGYAGAVADELLVEASEHRAAAKDIAKRKPPLTRRQIAAVLGKRQTGIFIRAGVLTPDGALTDTQTAAHTYDPTVVARVITNVAEARTAEARLLLTGAKTRIPA
jgi:hypothetical protein